MGLYPLKFRELYKEKIWGGREIEKVLGKRLPEGARIGESWEISDHFEDVSVIRNGPLAGRTLREVWRAAPNDVLGKALASSHTRWFPLLIKFIDASEVVSVQVHPDDAYAAGHDPNGDGGKNEAWYILAAASQAALVLGLRQGTTADELVSLLGERRLGECLHSLSVYSGDTLHVAAGTVHALGKGIVLCEIQQTSDATYRIWDWNRPGPDGKPRPLHIEHALKVIDFARGPVEKSVPVELVPGRLLLDTCPYFRIERIEASDRFTEPPLDGRFYILIAIGGSGGIICGGERHPYQLGETILFPAALGPVTIEPAVPSVFLKTFIP
jgi:mannose-6-phosphate isomerase